MRSNPAHFFAKNSNSILYTVFLRSLIQLFIATFFNKFIFSKPLQELLWSLCNNKKKKNFFSKGFPFPSGLEHLFLKLP